MRWFKTYMAAYRHELKQLAIQPNTYIFLTFAWVGMALATFYIGGFFQAGQAQMTLLFMFQPWIYLLLMPALAMGSWSEEWRRHTAERLLTLPISPFWLTLAKFKALQTLMVVVLLGTLPMVGTLYWLGNPAWGPIVTGYVGAVLIGSAMLALALAASQLSRAQSGAFVAGVLVLFIMIASGWGLLTNLLEGFLPQRVIDILVQYSLLDRFRGFYEGVIDGRDVIFFITLTCAALFLTHISVLTRLGRWNRVWKWIPIIAVTVLLNAAILPLNSQFFRDFLQWDATPDKRHTLGGESVEFIEGLEHKVKLKYYFSASNGDVPVAVQQFARRTLDKLKDIQAVKPEMVELIRIDPSKNVDLEVQAINQGLEEQPLPSGEGYYFGLVFESGGRVARIPFLTPVRQAFLEFDIMSGFIDLSRTKKPRIGILTSLNLGIESEQKPRFIQDLLDTYEIELIKSGEPEFPENLDLALIFMNPFLEEETLFALDQYMVNGGRAVLILDPFLRTVPTADLQVPDRNADEWAQDHPADLLRHWGVNYNYKEIVADPAAAMTVRLPDVGMTRYPLWLLLGQLEINQTYPFTRFVNSMLFAESGHFTQIEIPQYLNYTPLITSTEKSQIVLRHVLDTQDPQALTDDFQGKQTKRDLVVLLSGKFPSVYKEVPKAVTQYYEDFAPIGEEAKVPALKTLGKEGKLLVLGDLDFLADDYAMRQEVIFDQQVSRPANDNLAFFYNAIQYLMGETVLLPLRGKTVDNRPFVRIEKMLADVAGKYQRLEQELVAELFQVARRLEELRNRSRQKQTLETEVQKEIVAFQTRELDVKKRLRDVRRTLRQDVEKLERTIVVLNMSIAPVLAWLYAAVLFYQRRRRVQKLIKN